MLRKSKIGYTGLPVATDSVIPHARAASSTEFDLIADLQRASWAYLKKKFSTFEIRWLASA